MTSHGIVTAENNLRHINSASFSNDYSVMNQTCQVAEVCARMRRGEGGRYESTFIYRKVSNISRTKYQNLNASRFIW